VLFSVTVIHPKISALSECFHPLFCFPMRHLRLTGLLLKQQAHHHYQQHASKDLYRVFYPEDSKKKTVKDEEKKVSSEIVSYLALRLIKMDFTG